MTKKDRSQDRPLLARLRAGDEQAVRELRETYGSKIYQLAYRHLRNVEDAEEVTQDVLLKVFRKADAFRGDSALSSWIYRITFNTAMSRLRSSKVERRTEQERERIFASGGPERDTSPAQQPDWSRLPDEALLRAELREQMAAALEELPGIYRDAIVLRDIEGLTTEEAGRRLQLNAQTLKSRLHRGRVMLRHELRRFKGGLTLHVRPATAMTIFGPTSAAA